ncbi:hypothetical protein L6452_17905 [Arctium lappa]|uniref:Uncharacterized protein n=1 Tax=Arctium lappa TaxID=4217 RepID=A0ACB9C4Z1_ARCLA|nr:hypothetical protein L6452_17905 [Arctium lappa]
MESTKKTNHRNEENVTVENEEDVTIEVVTVEENEDVTDEEDEAKERRRTIDDSRVRVEINYAWVRFAVDS